MGELTHIGGLGREPRQLQELRERMEEMLKKATSSDYYDYERSETERLLRQKRRLAWEQCGLEPEERLISMASLTPHRHQAPALKALQAIRDAFAGDLCARGLPWVVLSSDHGGSGKTHLAMALVADLCRMGVAATFSAEAEHMRRLRAANGRGSEVKPDQVREEWLAPALLVIDDLCTQAVTEFSASEMYDVINTRLRRRRCTVMTTNCKPDAIAAYYGQQGPKIVSRILGQCDHGRNWIRMDGPDLRVER